MVKTALDTLNTKQFRVWLLAVFSFSAMVFLVHWAGLTIPVIGTYVGLDPREVFLTLGAALTGPVGGLMIGFFAGASAVVSDGLSTPNINGLADLAAHAAGGILIGLIYWPLYQHWRIPKLLWGWAGLLMAYYFIFITPIFMATALLLDAGWLLKLDQVRLSLFQAYLLIASTALPEAALTIVITGLTLLALPEKYRCPLWKSSCRPQSTRSIQPIVDRPGLLAVRLTYWFVLFASLPLLVLVIFARQSTQTTFVELEQQYQHQLATSLAGQVTNVADVAAARQILATLAADDLTGFFLSDSGEILVASAQDQPVDNLSAAARNAILSERNGVYAVSPEGPRYAFAPVPGQKAVLVISPLGSAASNQYLRLERRTFLQLLVAMLIMFIGSGLMVWLLVGQPVRKLTRAAGQISTGQFKAKVNPDDMIDDLALLGASFNTMSGQIGDLVEDLEQRVADRTEELSAFFDLTVLAGQGANIADVFQQALPRILELSHIRVICLHLFNAEQSSLVLAAQQNLSADAHGPLVYAEMPRAFQTWLAEARNPLVITTSSNLTDLPPRLQLEGFHTYLGAQVKIGDRIEGVLSCFRYSNRGFGLDEISLVSALAEQLAMMLEIYHLRQTAQEMAMLEERQRLARDLHDSVTQSLYGVSLLSGACREAAADGDTERLNQGLALVEQNALQTLREMRLLLYELRPADLQQEGLKRAIALRLSNVEQRVGLQLDVQLDEFPELSPTNELELYHIIVEALNNIRLYRE